MSIELEARTLELVKRLPEHSFLKQYINYGMSITDANAAFHVAGGLMLLACTAPITMKADFAGTIRPALFSMLYGPSTESRKTSCVRLSRETLARVDVGHLGPEPGSWEGLLESIRDTPRQGLYYDEFGNFLAKSEEGYLRQVKTGYNLLVDGSPLARVTVKDKGKKLAPLTEYSVSMMVGIAPVLLETHADLADWNGGFLGRFLVFDGTGRPRHFPKPKSNPEGLAPLDNILKAKLSFSTVGKYLGMTPAAENHWIAYANDVEALKNDVPDTAKVALHRSQQLGMKIAMLLSWDYGEASTGGDWHITDDEVGAAVEIAKMHMNSAVAIGSRLAVDHDMRDRRKVLSVIPRDGTVTLGDILLKAEMLRPRGKMIVETLIEEGSIVIGSVSSNKVSSYRRVLPLPSETTGAKLMTDLIGTGRVRAELEAQKARGEFTNVVPFRRPGEQPAQVKIRSEIDNTPVTGVVDDGKGSEAKSTEGDFSGPDGTPYDPNAPKI